jgi:hypothetical protein
MNKNFLKAFPRNYKKYMHSAIKQAIKHFILKWLAVRKGAVETRS